jgi:excisionase family DNA binding protein
MLLDVKQVAGELNFSEQQIYRWARLGALSAVRFGHALRFNREEIDRVKRAGIVPDINLPNSENRLGRSRIPSLSRKGARLWE